MKSEPPSAKKERTVTIVDRVSSVSSGASKGVSQGSADCQVKGAKDGFRVLEAEVIALEQKAPTAATLP